MQNQRTEKYRFTPRGSRKKPALPVALFTLVVLGGVFASCSTEKSEPPEKTVLAEKAGCAVKGFYLGMPIRDAVDRVNKNYLGPFGPPKYKTNHAETQQWMEKLPVKPVRVNYPAPGFKEYVYDKFYVVRYRDDGREYMFPFSPFMTDEDGKVISIFLIGPIARKLFAAEKMDQDSYLDMLSGDLNIQRWRKQAGSNKKPWWSARLPGECKLLVFQDKGMKLLPTSP